MEYVCDAPHNRTWFRLVTEGEAVAESLEMHHAVEKHYRRERERAVDAFHPDQRQCSSSRTSTRKTISGARCRCS